MELNKEQIQQLAKHLNEKWPSPRNCYVCNDTQWEISNKVFEIREFFGGALTAGPVIPIIVLVCKNCGHTVFFSAMRLGVVKPEEKEENRDE
ncbi:MAG: hypothetical protein ACE5JP_07125 [Candidatus Bipolaricaulia bacterium]